MCRHTGTIKEEDSLLKDVRWTFDTARRINAQNSYMSNSQRDKPDIFFWELLGGLEQKHEAYDQQVHPTQSSLRKKKKMSAHRAYDSNTF